MRTATQKLNSRRGASILLALMFFLICAVIGSIALFSAYTNAGRMTHMRAEQQAYLTVSSAAKLVRSEIEGQSYTAVAVSIDGATPTNTVTAQPGGALGARLNAWCEHWYGGSFFSPIEDFTVTSDAVGDVAARLTMDSGYNITAVFVLADGSGEQYSMTLKMPASVDVSSVTSRRTYTQIDGYDADGNPIIGIYEEVTVTTTTVVTWGDAVITKGAA